MTNLTPDPLPADWPSSAKLGAAMVYDTKRHVSVLFPGAQIVAMNPPMNPENLVPFSIWEWDGVHAWTDRSSAVPADFPALSGEAAAYDSSRGVAVLFSGAVSFSLTSSSDTWEWDGTTLTHPQPTVSPPGRTGAAMAYDPVRKVTVLFGGNGSYNDLWEWNGVSWTNRTPPTVPVVWPRGRENGTLVWDSEAPRLLLFGGSTGGANSAFSDLWSWDGNTWTDLTPRNPPAAWPLKRSWHGAAFDDCRGVMLVFGGIIDDPTVGRIGARDLWQWNSHTGTFQDLTPSMPPPLPASVWPVNTYDPAVGFDSTYERLIIFGGASGSGDVARLMYVYGP
jgi:hypothetical protein